MSRRPTASVRRSRHRPEGERARELGMTLIEMIIAVAMLMIVMVGVYKALRTANTSATALSEMSQQEADSRRAVDIMVTDLRMAWTGSTSQARIDTAFNACTVTFYAPTRDATAKLRRIQYTVTGADLLRSETVSTNTAPPWTWPGSWSPSVRVLGGLHNVPAPSSAGCSAAYPVFTYYDKADAVLALPGSATDAVAVKRIELDLTIDRIVGKFPDPDVFATSVELRSQ